MPRPPASRRARSFPDRAAPGRGSAQRTAAASSRTPSTAEAGARERPRTAASISSSPSSSPIAVIACKQEAHEAGRQAATCSTVSFGWTSACCTISALVSTLLSLAACVTRWTSLSVKRTQPDLAGAEFRRSRRPEAVRRGISTVCRGRRRPAGPERVSGRGHCRSGRRGVLDLHPECAEADLLHDEVVLRQGVVPLGRASRPSPSRTRICPAAPGFPAAG